MAIRTKITASMIVPTTTPTMMPISAASCRRSFGLWTNVVFDDGDGESLGVGVAAADVAISTDGDGCLLLLLVATGTVAGEGDELCSVLVGDAAVGVAVTGEGEEGVGHVATEEVGTAGTGAVVRLVISPATMKPGSGFDRFPK